MLPNGVQDPAFIAIMVLFMLVQIPLGSEYLKAGASDTSYLQALSAVSAQASQYAYAMGMITLGLASSIPGGLWEVFMGVWLIAKGFSSPAAVSESASAETKELLRAA